jgi:hypothetical protein
MPSIRVSGLEWFLNFFNLKIEELDRGDRLKWITEALYMIEFGRPKIGLRMYPIPDKITSQKRITEWDKDNRLERCQKLVKDFYINLMKNIENSIDTRKNWLPRNNFGFNKSIFIKFDTQANVRVQVPVSSGVEWKIENEDTDNEQLFCRINRKKMYERKLHVTFNTISDEDSLLLAFCQSFEGIPIGAFRTCPECDKFFLHLSKKQKVFCNNKCAARSGSRAKRHHIKKNDPKAYEKMIVDGAKRARKSFKKRQKKVNPGATVARRPTKHKD